VSVAAKPVDGVQSGIAVYGYTDGSIKRTTDFCATAPATVHAAAPADGTINYLQWDMTWPLRVWAGTSTGRLYQSLDDGVTWALYKDFGGTYPINNIGTPYGGGVWVFGGRGDVPATLIQYDPNLSGTFYSPTIGGELLADLAASTSALTVASAASFWQGTAIIFKGELAGAAGTGVNLFYVDNINGDGTGWKRGTGADLVGADLSDGRYVIGDRQSGVYHAAFGDRNTWHTTDGVAWTKTANALPAGVTPNHCIWLGAWLEGSEQVHLVAAENAGATLGIYKSTDGLVTLLAMRPATGFPAWPASAKAKMLAVGAPNLGVTYDDRLAALGLDVATREVSTLIGPSTNWTTPVSVTGTTSAHPRLFCPTSSLWFTVNHDGTDDAWGWGVGSRSKTAGATWAATPDPGVGSGGIMHVAIDAAGRVWSIVHTTHAIYTVTEVYYSDDDGDNWTLSYTYGNGSSQAKRTWKIIPHPTNQQIIAIVGYDGVSQGFILYTLDRGASWGANSSTEINKNQALVDHYYDALLLPNGRILVSGPTGGSGAAKWRVKYSDNWGQTWATAFSVDNGSGSMGTLYRNAAGTTIGFLYDDVGLGAAWRLYLSTDSGATFPVQTLAVELETFVGDNTLTLNGRMASSFDTIYLATDHTVDICRLKPISADGVWTNLTDAYPHAAQGNRNLAVIPA
jgi:hypothetical protein